MTSERRTIFKCITGSHLYGTNTPESDIDYYEVFFEPKEWYLGLKAVHDPKGKMTVTDDVDTTRHEFRHFLRLCLAYNPNIVEVLHSPEMMTKGHIAMLLYANRSRFVSQRSIKALVGYAIRMRADVLETWRTGKQGCKRKSLIDQFGYDTKAASHAYRLAYAAARLSATGGREHVVSLVNHPTLLSLVKDIRAGHCSKDKVLEMIQDFIEVADKGVSSLPEDPDYEWANNFCIYTLKEYINGQ
jgi:hypothetical protein